MDKAYDEEAYAHEAFNVIDGESGESAPLIVRCGSMFDICEDHPSWAGGSSLTIGVADATATSTSQARLLSLILRCDMVQRRALISVDSWRSIDVVTCAASASSNSCAAAIARQR